MSTNDNAASRHTSVENGFSTAVAAHQRGDLPGAVGLYRIVLKQRPDFVPAWLNLGLALGRLGEGAAAIECFETALQINPRQPGANLAMGALLKQLGRMDEAAECCRREIKINAGNADAHYNLGLTLQNQGHLDEAARCYETTLKLRPDYVDALVNRSYICQHDGELNAAVGYLERALKLQPALPRAHWSLARALLMAGDYTRGFIEHEWRWKMNDFTTPAWNFPQPLWNGESLEGRTILLHAEQGAGDTLQFIRYAPLVAQRAARLIVGCPKDLERLVRTIPGVSDVATSREHLPPFDTHAPVMSLPRIFQTSLASIPAQVPYLRAPAVESRLEGLIPGERGSERLRLGLVWAGGISDSKRDVPLETFLPLLEVPGLSLYSLQVGERVKDLSRLPQAPIADCGSALTDFADTASLLTRLDGLISVDTSVAHLAGALGRPTWTLLHYSADWRWLREREDSPWYPTLRLFRQPSPGNWKPVVARLTAMVAQILQSDAPPGEFARSCTQLPHADSPNI